MRTLEILIPILLAIYLLFGLYNKVAFSKIRDLLRFIIFVTTILHVTFEGARWQMIPLYTFALIVLIPAVLRISKDRKVSEAATKPVRAFVSLLLLVVSTSLPYLLPVPTIPPPGGRYQVGTRIYELVDSSRKELYSGVDEHRKFQIQVWYPTEAEPDAKHAPWMARAEIYAPTLSKDLLGLPVHFLDHLSLAKEAAYVETPTASTANGFPIILFSHGIKSFNAQNTAQALELASHGFVVVGVQHPYGAIITVFNDGSIAKYKPEFFPAGEPNEEYQAKALSISNTWSEDLSYALTYTEELNNDPTGPFYKKFDTSHVGVYGHSTGGGAAIRFCATDDRCQALLGMDPFMAIASPSVIEQGIQKPAFFMFSDVWTKDSESRNNMFFHSFANASTDLYGVISIEGTDHYDFSDLPLLTPLAYQLGLKGPIDGNRVTLIIKDYLLSFFDASLNQVPTDLFELEKYPEVQQRN